MAITPTIPETITVHLGRPDDNSAQNVTVSFADYIKNVASSEIFPTWPDEAIRANIYAQISFALNRIYTEWYPSQGKDFDITNSTAFDQYFVNGRDIFSNISEIVDELFNDYLRRPNTVEPFFAQYCNGTTVTCDGLSQWGTVELANQGYTPFEILQFYYGDNLELVSNAPISEDIPSYPDKPLVVGDSGNDVKDLQVRLNRISADFPAIPKIYPVDGVFGVETEQAVRKFQEIFNLTIDGIVGKATWYKIIFAYNSVKDLAELTSEGLTYDEISRQYPGELKIGDSGIPVANVQYYLKVISQFYPPVPPVIVDGLFGIQTENSVKYIQGQANLPQTGIIDRATWNVIYKAFRGIVTNPQNGFTSEGLPVFGGKVLKRGSVGDDVTLMQEYLNYIAKTYPQIGIFTPTGFYGELTEKAVKEFQTIFGISPVTGTIGAITWDSISDVYSDLSQGFTVSTRQYPGYILKEEV